MKVKKKVLFFQVHTVLACVFGLGFSYPDTTGGFVSRPGGVGLGGVGLRAGLRSAPVTVSRTPALISVPQSGARVVSPPLGGGVVSRPLHAGPVVSPLPLRTNVITGPAVVTSGPVGVLGSRPLPALATGVAGVYQIGTKRYSCIVLPKDIIKLKVSQSHSVTIPH